MDQKQETVSNCCATPRQPKPPMSLEQAQIELVMSERDLVLAEKAYNAADEAHQAAERAERVSNLNRQSALSRRDYYRELVTKAVRAMALGLGLCLLLSRFAQAQTITIPVTVPPPPPLTVTIPPGTKLVSGGMTYLVTGTLTLTLTTPDVTPPPSTGMTFNGYRDRNRNVIQAIAAGDILVIQGSGFGVAGASVTIGGIPAKVMAQSDSEISVTVPNVSGAVTLVVNGTVDSYPLTVTPQTTLLPGRAPGDLAPYDWPPFVVDFRDSHGQHVETVALGDTLTLIGNSFGDQGGVLWVGNEAVPTAKWTDEAIDLSLDPLLIGPAPHGSLWVIRRSGGAHGTAWGPVILPNPAG